MFFIIIIIYFIFDLKSKFIFDIKIKIIILSTLVEFIFAHFDFMNQQFQEISRGFVFANFNIILEIDLAFSKDLQNLHKTMILLVEKSLLVIRSFFECDFT